MIESKRSAVLEALKVGNTRRSASAVAGVTHDTFYRWFRDDKTFADAVARAEGEAEAFFVSRLKAGADEDWRAAESWLKRARRDEWGDAPDLRKLPDDVLIRLLMGALGQQVEPLPGALSEPAEDVLFHVEPEEPCIIVEPPTIEEG